jgi:hypothetical protein
MDLKLQDARETRGRETGHVPLHVCYPVVPVKGI